MTKIYSADQFVIDEVIKLCAGHSISQDALTLALLSLLHSAMVAAGAEEHTLSDGDGVCILHAKVYE